MTFGIQNQQRQDEAGTIWETMLQEALDNQSTTYEQVSQKIDCPDNDKLNFPFWLGGGVMGDWSLSGKAKKALEAFNIEIPILDKEETFEVRKVTLQSTQTLGIKFAQQQAKYGSYYNQLVVAALTGGLSNVGADGLATFHDSHAGPGGTSQDNKRAFAASYDGLASCQNVIRNFKDPISGAPIGPEPDLVICGNNLRKAFSEVLYGNLTSGSGGSNVMVGAAKLVIFREIDNNTWYCAASQQSCGVAPVLIAVHQDITPVNDLDLPYRDRPTVNFGVEAHLGIDLAPWFNMVINEI